MINDIFDHVEQGCQTQFPEGRSVCRFLWFPFNQLSIKACIPRCVYYFANQLHKWTKGAENNSKSSRHSGPPGLEFDTCDVEDDIGKSLYADDGGVWKRGRNLAYCQMKLQAAIKTVEQWSNKWGFKLSVEKTQVICFSRRHKEISLKLYDQTLKQFNVMRLIGLLFDERLTWKQHIYQVKEKCKKVNNLLRCLSGWDWGPTRSSLFRIYQAVMRATIDSGCVAYTVCQQQIVTSKNWIWSRREGSGYAVVHLKYHQYRPCRLKWGNNH